MIAKGDSGESERWKVLDTGKSDVRAAMVIVAISEIVKVAIASRRSISRSIVCSALGS